MALLTKSAHELRSDEPAASNDHDLHDDLHSITATWNPCRPQVRPACLGCCALMKASSPLRRRVLDGGRHLRRGRSAADHCCRRYCHLKSGETLGNDTPSYWIAADRECWFWN